MSNQIARIGIVAVAALTLAACVDDQELFAPPTPYEVDVAHDFTIEIPGPEDFMAITAGEFHTCALRGNGSVLCWGQEGGPLAIAPLMQTPTLAFSDAIMIDAGANHTCALDTKHAAHCWGAGDKGQLGYKNGFYIPYSTSIAVEGPIGQPTAPLSFNTISAGGSSTCGLAPSGVFCWGEQGNSTNPNVGVNAPVQISAFSAFTGLTVGNRHACGQLGNEALCWGANNFGQSGVDPATAVFHPGTSLLTFAQPSSFGPAVARVSTQHDFTCADMTDGTIRCFGSNSDAQLGNNGATGSTHRPQRVGRGQQLHGVSTGTAHACALDIRNEAWCWGANSWGQLGNGAANKLMGSPVRVTGRRSYKALAAGRNHTCGIATDNHVYCWGQNNFRQLGTWIVDVNGILVTNGHSPDPVLVM